MWLTWKYLWLPLAVGEEGVRGSNLWNLTQYSKLLLGASHIDYLQKRVYDFKKPENHSTKKQ